MNKLNAPTLLTADQVRAMVRTLIAERYESQAQAARNWNLAPQILNAVLQGRRPIPGVLLDKFGIQPVTMYRRNFQQPTKEG